MSNFSLVFPGFYCGFGAGLHSPDQSFIYKVVLARLVEKKTDSRCPMSLRSLPPTLREKTRYILCEVTGVTSLASVQERVQGCVLHYAGIKGLAQAGVYVVPSHSQLPYVVLRTTTTGLEDVKKSLQFFSAQGQGTLRTLKVSGLLSRVVPENMTLQHARKGMTKHTVKLCKAQIIN